MLQISFASAYIYIYRLIGLSSDSRFICYWALNYFYLGVGSSLMIYRYSLSPDIYFAYRHWLCFLKLDNTPSIRIHFVILVNLSPSFDCKQLDFCMYIYNLVPFILHVIYVYVGFTDLFTSSRHGPPKMGTPCSWNASFLISGLFKFVCWTWKWSFSSSYHCPLLGGKKRNPSENCNMLFKEIYTLNMLTPCEYQLTKTNTIV